MMEFTLSSIKVHFLVFLFALSSICKFMQSPMDFDALSLLPTTESASVDFGRIYFNTPNWVLRPTSAKEISLLLSGISRSPFQHTVAAKGAGHSINGQAQALGGIIIEMDALPKSMKIYRDKNSGISYADVSGGTLWGELLEETLKQGLAPYSWTDYLYLSIGGTLSNAGISGQTFKYGPQISNVLQLDVVTGSGELLICSPSQNSELFYGVLGGLGQFGIITSARILLQQAPTRVKWARAFYKSFEDFMKDQELLIVEMADLVDYVEGFFVLNEGSLHSANIAYPTDFSSIIPKLFPPGASPVYYCIEFAINDVQPGREDINLGQVVEAVSRKMNFMPSLLFSVEVSYFDFLNRVGVEEAHLRQRGLWDISHPWLNMFVPRSGITKFRDLLLDTISPQSFIGPVLIYPILRDKWNSKSSVVLPDADIQDDENILYIVGILRSAHPKDCLNDFLEQNRQLTTIVSDPVSGIGGKQYLPHYTHEEKWREHFGSKWGRFMLRKSRFDPLNILGPGQAIFKRRPNYFSSSISSSSSTSSTTSSSSRSIIVKSFF